MKGSTYLVSCAHKTRINQTMVKLSSEEKAAIRAKVRREMLEPLPARKQRPAPKQVLSADEKLALRALARQQMSHGASSPKSPKGNEEIDPSHEQLDEETSQDGSLLPEGSEVISGQEEPKKGERAVGMAVLDFFVACLCDFFIACIYTALATLLCSYFNLVETMAVVGQFLLGLLYFVLDRLLETMADSMCLLK